MKRIVLIALLCLGIGAAAAPLSETVTPATDSRVTFVGRTLKSGDAVSFDWSSVSARIAFEGRYLAMKASDTHKNYFNVWIDRPTWEEPDRIVATEGEEQLIVLADDEYFSTRYGKKGPASHTVTLQKRTEGEQGTTCISAFVTRGALLQAEGPRERLIEIIGDSYTCGYGSENSIRTDPFTPETENVNKSYSNILPRYFDADVVLVAHSGMGIARNYNDNVKGWYMPERYLQTFDMDRESRWQADIRPDISIIYLCTNDFSTSRQPSKAMFIENYVTLIKEIKANYGEGHPVLCVAGKNDFLMAEYIHEAVAGCGLTAVSYAVLAPDVHNSDSDLGASWHPNYEGHKKKAYALIPYVATITGWGLSDKPIR